MTLIQFYNTVMVVGFLLTVFTMLFLHKIIRRWYVVLCLATVGIAMMVFGGGYGAYYRQMHSAADIAARTVVISGVVYHSVPLVGVKGCSLVLEGLPSVTFILPKRSSFLQSCDDVKLGHNVDVKYVQPKKKAETNWSMEYIEALDFFDRTDVDPPPAPGTLGCHGPESCEPPHNQGSVK